MDVNVQVFTDSLWLILASRLVGGIMSSNIVVAQAYIADVTEASKRVAAFGRIGAIFGIAFILGPALGGMLGEVDPRIPFLCAGVICIINFFYGLFVLPESLREFTERYGETKRDRGIMDYDDLEQFALKILLRWDEEKQVYVRTEAAGELAE